jgi:predicted chitinase
MITNTEMQNILNQINGIVKGLEERIQKLEEANKESKGGKRGRKTLPSS